MVYRTMDYESRRATFVSSDCPDTLRRGDLAALGFYFTGYGRLVKCPFCFLQLDVAPSTNAFQLHRLQKPSCPYSQFINNDYIAKFWLNKKGSDIDRLFHVFLRLHRQDIFTPRRFEFSLREKEEEPSHRPTCLGNEDCCKCKVCFVAHASVVLLPCKHLILCESCSSRCTSCPTCRSRIDRVLRVYT